MELFNFDATTQVAIYITLTVATIIYLMVFTFSYFKLAEENRELKFELDRKTGVDKFLTRLESESGVDPLYSELFKIYQSPGNVVLTGIDCSERTDNWTTVVDFQDKFVRVFTINYAEDGKLSITSPFWDYDYEKTTLRQFLKNLSENYDIDFGYSEFHDKDGQFIVEFVENYGERFAGGLEAYRNQNIAERIEQKLYDEFVDGE